MGEGLRLDAVRANEHLLLETPRQWRYLADASQSAMRPTRSFFLGAMCSLVLKHRPSGVRHDVNPLRQSSLEALDLGPLARPEGGDGHVGLRLVALDLDVGLGRFALERDLRLRREQGRVDAGRAVSLGAAGGSSFSADWKKISPVL